MKRLFIVCSLGMTLLFAASSARADFISFALDAPVSYDFDKGGSADSVSGFKAGVSLPVFPVGIGYESYEVSDKSGGGESKVDFSIYDLFLNIPLPVINIALGLVAGNADLKIDSLGVDESTTASQYWLSLGIPFAKVFDIHAGYHVVTAKFDKVNVGGGVTQDIDASGTMISLGLKFGF